MIQKNIYISIALATMMASCSQEVIQETSGYDHEVYATIPELIDGNAAETLTRSTLTYDSSSKKMLFKWEDGDQIGVFPINSDPSKRQQKMFELKTGAGSSMGEFDSFDTQLRTISKDRSYIAFRPYTTEDDYSTLNMDYGSQTAKAFPKMKYNPGFSGNPNADASKYNASEAAASAHLGSVDYMVSDPVVATEDAHCGFQFQRMGAIVRFYMKSPKEMIYDGIQLVAKGKKFTIKGMLKADTKTIVPVTTSNAMNLTFSPALDMRSNTSEYHYKEKGYIVSYMMVAPVNLSEAEEVSIYLKGHIGSTSYYYKAKGDIKKPNLTANMFYQWTSADNDDDPAIRFDEISVQDWEADVTYGNGEEGTGTGNW